MSMTMFMSCSISRIVTPSSSWMSLIQKIRSCRSSEFMPAQGSSSRSRSGSKRERPGQLDQFLGAVGEPPHELVARRLEVQEVDDPLHLAAVDAISSRPAKDRRPQETLREIGPSA